MTFIKANRVYYNGNLNKYIEDTDIIVINMEHIITVKQHPLPEQFIGDVTKPTFRVTMIINNYQDELVVTSEDLEMLFKSSPIDQEFYPSGLPEAKE